MAFSVYPDYSHWKDPQSGCSVMLRRSANLVENTSEWYVSYDEGPFVRVTNEDFLQALTVPPQMKYVAMEMLRRHVNSDAHSKATYGLFPPRDKVSRCEYL